MLGPKPGFVKFGILVIFAVLFLSQPAKSQSILSDGLPVKVETKKIDYFQIGRQEHRFGKLTFLGGLEIIASDRKIGGLSGLLSLKGGEEFFAVTDNGHWVSGTVKQAENGAPNGIENVRYAPLLGADGKTLKARWGHDTEALALSRSGLYVTAETRNAVYHYPWPIETGSEKMIGTVALPKQARELPRNAGLEALAAMPLDGDFSGSLIAISETARSSHHNLRGFILGPSGPSTFELRRRDDFDVTDAAFLPNGDLLVLERRFNLRNLIGMRLRQIEKTDIEIGAIVDGEMLLEANFNFQIDNMEALAVHQNLLGETIITLVSDNNRSILQRTLFLRFRLDPANKNAN